MIAARTMVVIVAGPPRGPLGCGYFGPHTFRRQGVVKSLNRASVNRRAGLVAAVKRGAA